MLKVYILDDEQNAVDGLKAMLLKKFQNEVEILGSNCNPHTAIAQIEELDLDLLFLDVEMPLMNGLEVLKHFPNRNFQVIFTTTHDQYAIPAIKADAVDYLLKPLAPSDVNEALKRCLEKKSQQVEGSQLSGKISVSVSGEFHILNVNDIVRIEADNNYSSFYFVNRSRIIVSKTLKEFENMLLPYPFYRSHQSHLINLLHVKGIHTNEGDVIVMSNGDKVELSRRKKADFLMVLKKITTG